MKKVDLIVSDPIFFTDQQTAEHFAQTVNKLKGKVTILFITHQLPKGLQVDEAVVLGKADAAQQFSQQTNKSNSEELIKP